MYSHSKTLNHTPKTGLTSDMIFIFKDVRKDGSAESNSISIHLYTDTGFLRGPQIRKYPDWNVNYPL